MHDAKTMNSPWVHLNLNNNATLDRTCISQYVTASARHSLALPRCASRGRCSLLCSPSWSTRPPPPAHFPPSTKNTSIFAPCRTRPCSPPSRLAPPRPSRRSRPSTTASSRARSHRSSSTHPRASSICASPSDDGTPRRGAPGRGTAPARAAQVLSCGRGSTPTRTPTLTPSGRPLPMR